MKRGLFRVWAVGSTVWLAAYLWFEDTYCALYNAGISFVGGPWCPFRAAEPDIVKFTAYLIGPPLLAGALILACCWIMAGFRSK